MHKLDDRTLITPLLLRRFRAEGEFEGANGLYAAYIQKSDGNFLRCNYICKGGMLEQMFAEDMLNVLNRNIAHDGAWVVVYTHFAPPRPPEAEGVFHRVAFLWMDKDGDVKFTVERDQPLHQLIAEVTLDDLVNQCEAAWGLRRWSDQVLDVKPSQQYRRALGEKPPSIH